MKKAEDMKLYEAGVEYIVDGNVLNKLSEMGIDVTTRQLSDEKKKANKKNIIATCKQTVNASFGF